MGSFTEPCVVQTGMAKSTRVGAWPKLALEEAIENLPLLSADCMLMLVVERDSDLVPLDGDVNDAAEGRPIYVRPLYPHKGMGHLRHLAY